MTRNVEDEGAPTASPIDPPARRGRRLGMLLALVAAIAVAAAVARMALTPVPEAPRMAMAPPAVTVAAPLRRRIATTTGFTGQFSAAERVEIRAQVGGTLERIDFTDGQLVGKGEPLFLIDPRPYDIALSTARAQLATAEAALKLSGQQLARTSNLVTSAFASRETLDQRTEQQLAAQAALDGAGAAVRRAELDLSWTRIAAPMAGRIGRHLVSVGNLVAGGQGATTLLATVVSLDPIYLDFDMGEGDFVSYQRFLQAARREGGQDGGQDGGRPDRTVAIELTGETGFAHRGTLDFLDNEMDRSSGTLHARATVPNPDLAIAPGQFARLRVPTSAPAERLLVPEAALSTDQARTLVMTVAKDGTVVPKPVEIGDPVGPLRIVKSGLAADDRVVIDGLMFARPGGKVTPQPGAIAPPGQG